jgi:hypothetical protein
MLMIITQTVKTCLVKKAAATTMANAPHIITITIPMILMNINVGTTTTPTIATTDVEHAIILTH